MARVRKSAVVFLILLSIAPGRLHASDPSTTGAVIQDIVLTILRSLANGKIDPVRTGEAPAWTPEEVGAVSKEMVSDLIVKLKSDDWRARGRAATALGLIGPEAKDSIPALREQLGHKSGAIRSAAAGAIWSITGESSEMCPMLTGLLRGRVQAYHISAAIALGAVGPPARVAVPKLIEALDRDKFPSVRATAAVSLAKIGVADEAVVRALGRAQRDGDPSVREAAGKVLQILRSGSSPTAPAPRQTASAPPETTAATRAMSLAGAVTCEAGETAQRYGIKAGTVGDISLSITSSSGDQAQVSGKLNVKLAEKPYYADSPILHAYDCTFSGQGSKSDDGKWHFTAIGRYSEKVEGAVKWDAEGSAVVEFDLLPDNSVQGVIRGMGAWSPYRFRASAK